MPYKEQLTWIGFAFKPGKAYPPPPQNAFNEFIIPKSNPLIVIDKFSDSSLYCCMRNEQ